MLTDTRGDKQMEQIRSFPRSTRGREISRLVAAGVVSVGLCISLFSSADATADSLHASKAVVVSTAKNAKVGTYLVSGRTLYTLKANATPCTAKCLKYWPQLLLPNGVTKATAGSGVSASKLGTLRVSGGALQVTYGGKALYFYSGDKAAGQVNGDVTDTWGKWSAVVTVKATKATTGTTGSGNSGTGGVAF
jgi:predicted lipoprotein with Yx(FWY)xxD motif